MECLTLNRALSDYLQGRGTDESRREMQRHLAVCATCANRADERVRANTRALPVRRPPASLETKLRIIASQQSAHRRKRLTFAHAFRDWHDHLRLSVNNMMRPLALPVAGGLLSTLVLFGILLPEFAKEVHPIRNDIEVSLFTAATIKDMSPIGEADTDITVDLTVDENGRMLEYRVLTGEHLLRDESLRRRLVYNLMYGQFNPATQFGQPVAGKLRVTFRSSTIDIRG